MGLDWVVERKVIPAHAAEHQRLETVHQAAVAEMGKRRAAWERENGVKGYVVSSEGPTLAVKDDGVGMPEGMDVIEVAGCVVEIEDEENRDNITFFIKDRDGTEKQLEVNQENWPDAYDSWLLMYEKQQVDKGAA